MAYATSINTNQDGTIVIGQVNEVWYGGSFAGFAEDFDSVHTTICGTAGNISLLEVAGKARNKGLKTHATTLEISNALAQLNPVGGGAANLDDLLAPYTLIKENSEFFWGDIDKGGLAAVASGDDAVNTVRIICFNGTYQNTVTHKYGYYMSFGADPIHLIQCKSVIFAFDENENVHFGRFQALDENHCQPVDFYIYYIDPTGMDPLSYTYIPIGNTDNFGFLPQTRESAENPITIPPTKEHKFLLGAPIDGLKTEDWCIYNDHYSDIPSLNLKHIAGSWSGGNEDYSPNEGDNDSTDTTDDAADYIPHDHDTGKTPKAQFGKDAINSGLISIFNPTQAEILAFCNFLFSGDKLTDNIIKWLKRLRSDPLDYIISLSMVHYKPTVQNSSEIKFGGIGSGVVAFLVSEQFTILDYGKVDIQEQYKNFMDYEDKIYIYLPYCGKHQLPDIDMLMQGKLGLQYIIDNLTGACVAQVTIENTSSKFDDVWNIHGQRYQFTGNVFQPLPLSAMDYKSYVSGILNAAGGVMGIATGNFAQGAANIATGVMQMKPNAEQKSTSNGSAFGYMEKQEPYVEVHRGTMSIPSNYTSTIAYPTNRYATISNLNGLTKLRPNTYKPTNINYITNEEIDELVSLFEDGVILPINGGSGGW